MMYPIIKRFFDFISSSIALLILAPMLIPLLIILRCTGEGEIFYLQKRLGFKNKWFNIYKFATMLKNSPNMGTGSITLRNDPRVTPVGKYLRITKVNELPQLLNVVNGTMSVVGPRPLMQVDFDAYNKEVQDNIYNVKPGITGIGSLIFRDEEKILSADHVKDPKAYYAKYVAPYKGALELWYAQNQSFWVDLKIIFLTFWAIVHSKADNFDHSFNNLPKKSDFFKV